MKHRITQLTLFFIICLICLCSCTARTNSYTSESEEDFTEPTLPSYNLLINVHYESNLILSKYDVNISIDNDKLGTIKQDEDFEKTVTLEEGIYTIRFSKTDDSSVNGETTIRIYQDSEFSCSIKAHYSNIDINNPVTKRLEISTSEPETTIPDPTDIPTTVAETTVPVTTIPETTIAQTTVAPSTAPKTTKPKNTTAPTTTPTKPTSVPKTEPPTKAPPTTVAQQENPKPQSQTHTYVLNTNTKKFHYEYCRSVPKINSKNKQFYTGTRNEIMSMGYDPCAICTP